MFRGRFLLPIIGLFVVFTLMWSVGNNRREEQDAWMQGYMAGQASVQQTDGGSVVNPLPYNMYAQGFRSDRGGPGFFGIIPVLLLGFIAFKVIRGGMFRRWQQAGGPGYGPWGNYDRHNHFDGRGSEGRGPRERGHHPERGEQRRPESPANERPVSSRPTDDEVI